MTFILVETSKQITVFVVGDTVAEPDESFNVTLSNPTAGLTIADGLGVVTITNDDALPDRFRVVKERRRRWRSCGLHFHPFRTTSAALTVNISIGRTAPSPAMSTHRR